MSPSVLSSCHVSTPGCNGSSEKLASPGLSSNDVSSPSATTKTVGNFDMGDMELVCTRFRYVDKESLIFILVFLLIQTLIAKLHSITNLSQKQLQQWVVHG